MRPMLDLRAPLDASCAGRIPQIDQFLRSHVRERYVFLYGEGVQDLFLTSSDAESTLTQVLCGLLKGQGYERIALFSPHRLLQFSDPESLQAALPRREEETETRPATAAEQAADTPTRSTNPSGKPGFNPAVEPLPAPPATSPTGRPVMRHIKNGPLGQVMLLKPALADTPSTASQETAFQSRTAPVLSYPAIQAPAQSQVVSFGEGRISDVSTIETLDAMMTQKDGPPTAIIFQQAETSLSHFDDLRTLAGSVAEWQLLPSSSRNICIFLFAADQPQTLPEIAAQLPVPELRNGLRQSGFTSTASRSLLRIGTPQTDELASLLTASPAGQHLQADPEELQQITRWMAAENKSLRAWLDQMEGLAEINRTTIRQAGWFQAVQDTTQPAEEKLHHLIGLETVKQHVQELSAWLNVSRRRQQDQIAASPPPLHMIFTGNPGTGKTTVARLMGELYHEIGLLARGHLVEVKASDLVADHVGGTAQKTNQVIDSAEGGILFLDEAYLLTEPQRGGYGREALDTLLTRMEDETHPWVLIAAGYPENMEAFYQANPGLARRIPAQNCLAFPDYSPEELHLILIDMLARRQYVVEENLGALLPQIIEGLYLSREENFGNAGEMRNLADALERQHAVRITQTGASVRAPLEEADLPPAYRSYLLSATPDLDSIFADLDQLVGMQTVKAELRKIAYRIQLEQALHHGPASPSQPTILRHFLFTGNPGTGKTTTARMLGKIFHSLGLLRKGHCVEVSRSDLVAEYVGQTAIKTTRKFKQALDGILFIDEAYALNSGREDYGAEAIVTLLKLMEKYQERVVVIAAGYPDKMQQFLDSNPGLHSRFQKQIHFADFEPAELHEILESLAHHDHLALPPQVAEAALQHLVHLKQLRPHQFGNARTVRQTYEAMKDQLALRFVEGQSSADDASEQNLGTFLLEDVADLPAS